MNYMLVAKHVMKQYGVLPSVWLAFGTEVLKNIIYKCLLAVLIGKIVAISLDSDTEATGLIFSLCAMLLGGALISVTGDYFFCKSTDAQYQKLASAFQGSLLSKRMSFFSNEDVGTLQTVFRDHMDGTIKVVRLFRDDILSVLASILLPVAALVFYDFSVAMAFLVIALVHIVFTNLSAFKVRDKRKLAIKKYKELTSISSDQLLNIVAIKAGIQEERSMDLIQSMAAEESDLFSSRHLSEVIIEFLKLVVSAVLVSVTIYFGISANLEANAKIELLVILSLFLIQVISAITDSPDLVKRTFEHLDRVAATLKKLSESSEEESGLTEPENHTPSAPAIELRNLSFKYDDEIWEKGVSTNVFEDVCFKVAVGEHVALMGESGVGKSTVSHLLLKFFDPYDGDVFIKGSTTGELSYRAVRKLISYAPQRSLLFNTSILENIRYYCPDKALEEVKKISKVADVHDFVMRQDKGYETIVGQQGGKLSGGQQQRLGIARALLKSAEIYIFDEPTSALSDAASVELIRDIRSYLSDKTVIFITHHQNVASEMDRIVSLDAET